MVLQKRTDREQQRKEKLEVASAFSGLLDDASGLDQECQAYLGAEMEKASNSDETALFDEYEVDTLDQLVQLEIRLMIDETTIVKRCKYCGRYFLTEKLTVDYCSRIAEGETKPCIAIGPKHTYTKHALRAATELQLIEVQLGEDLAEDDMEEFDIREERAAE